MYLLIFNWFWIIFNQTKALKCLSLNIVKCHHVRFGEWQSAWHREFIQVSPSAYVTSYSCSNTAVFPVSLSRSESTSGDLHHYVHHLITLRSVDRQRVGPEQKTSTTQRQTSRDTQHWDQEKLMKRKTRRGGDAAVIPGGHSWRNREREKQRWF